MNSPPFEWYTMIISHGHVIVNRRRVIFLRFTKCTKKKIKFGEIEQCRKNFLKKPEKNEKIFQNNPCNSELL